MPTEPERERSEGGKTSDVLARDSWSRYAGMGLSFAATIVLFGAAGWWVDGKLGTTPLFLVALVLLGFVGGLISMVKRVPPARGAKPADVRRDRCDQDPT